MFGRLRVRLEIPLPLSSMASLREALASFHDRGYTLTASSPPSRSLSASELLDHVETVEESLRRAAVHPAPGPLRFQILLQEGTLLHAALLPTCPFHTTFALECRRRLDAPLPARQARAALDDMEATLLRHLSQWNLLPALEASGRILWEMGDPPLPRNPAGLDTWLPSRQETLEALLENHSLLREERGAFVPEHLADAPEAMDLPPADPHSFLRHRFRGGTALVYRLLPPQGGLGTCKYITLVEGSPGFSPSLPLRLVEDHALLARHLWASLEEHCSRVVALEERQNALRSDRDRLDRNAWLEEVSRMDRHVQETWQELDDAVRRARMLQVLEREREGPVLSRYEEIPPFQGLSERFRQSSVSQHHAREELNRLHQRMSGVQSHLHSMLRMATLELAYRGQAQQEAVRESQETVLHRIVGLIQATQTLKSYLLTFLVLFGIFVAGELWVILKGWNAGQGIRPAQFFYALLWPILPLMLLALGVVAAKRYLDRTWPKP